MIYFSVLKRGKVEWIRVIVCCVDDCDVTMEKLEVSGEFVFCWAMSQAALTYYNCVSEVAMQNCIPL